MNKILLAISIAITLIASSCNQAAKDANEACKAAESNDIKQALVLADKAYENFNELNVDALCHLAASYAVITLTTGDQQAADRFQKCYKASMNADPAEAKKVYQSLDPQMADGLAIISGLLDGKENFIIDRSTDRDRDSIENLVEEDAIEGLSED
ncbi:MAG: hypothetical protein K2J18_02040 [Paramuribaculum sp.]|nr:hypothetical protein [Paramuribaculum sp.]